MTMTESAPLQQATRGFIKRSLAAPMLSRDHEAELGRRWVEERDETALHELVASHTRLVVSLATKFRGYGLPLGDLIQEGNIGLMEAATRFDPERGVRLSTYASWWIRAQIQDYILRHWSIVRLGTTASEKSLFFNLRRLRARIAAASVGYMSSGERAEVARTLGVKDDSVAAMEGRLSARDQSLNAVLAEDSEREWQDVLEDERPSPEEVVMTSRDAITRRRWLDTALRELPEREQLIIRERHLRDRGSTLEDLGRVLGISKERVRQLERRALDRLQRSLTQPAVAAASAGGRA